MRKRNIFVGLDVGTTKICALVGELTDKKMDIIAMGSAPSTGLRKGIVINIEATVHSIKKAVEEAEAKAGFDIRSVYVGIAGGHIKSFESYGAVGVHGKEIKQRDVDKVIASASVVYIPLDREVLHIIPSEFILDSQAGIKDPVGMSGVRLEAKVHIVTGAVSSVKNLLKCCEKAGLDVADIVLEPIASAEAVLTEDEKELGTALIDIGGGTTDIAIYKDGSLRHTAVLALGGNHFTNDIAVGLRIPVQEAERVKKRYGCAYANATDGATEIDMEGADRQLRKIQKKYITEIIQPRCEELSELIREEIEGTYVIAKNTSGIVLTGGASLLEGIDSFLESELGFPVRKGIPEGIRGNGLNNPMYSTGVGLILRGAPHMTEDDLYEGVLNTAFERMKGWVKDLFESGSRVFGNRKISVKQRI
ncbi:MAG: cell division protein FtsA [Nitrospirae bacterium]|nr:cell division protein FtsA [Nitrospirota bacterium]